jgi:hypothetical protein
VKALCLINRGSNRGRIVNPLEAKISAIAPCGIKVDGANLKEAVECGLAGRNVLHAVDSRLFNPLRETAALD